MNAETVIAMLSAGVAVGAAALSWRIARGNSLHNALELARSHYTHLTSAEVSAARGRVEFYRRGKQAGAAATKEVLGDYFTLLWAFEYVHAGRQSLTRQQRINGTGPAIEYLDRMVTWHLQEWNRRWPALREQVKAHLEDALDDHHSLETFCTLSDDVLGRTSQTEQLLQAMREEQAVGGRSNTHEAQS